MASAFGHAALVIGGRKLFPDKAMGTKVIILGICSAVFPDLDVFFRYIVDYSNPYYEYLEHRGITHSIFFAVLWAILITGIFHRKSPYKIILISFYFICTISHGILDAFTTGGAGIGFLMPFSTERYFTPFKVIKVSPIGISRFFSSWGVKVLKSEFFYIGIPSMLFYVLGIFLNRSIYKTEKD